jgi:hypothetical protein
MKMMFIGVSVSMFLIRSLCCQTLDPRIETKITPIEDGGSEIEIFNLSTERITALAVVAEGTPPPRGSPQNRPFRVTSKPANGTDPEQSSVIAYRPDSGKTFCATGAGWFILSAPGRRIGQRRDVT